MRAQCHAQTFRAENSAYIKAIIIVVTLRRNVSSVFAKYALVFVCWLIIKLVAVIGLLFSSSVFAYLFLVFVCCLVI